MITRGEIFRYRRKKTRYILVEFISTNKDKPVYSLEIRARAIREAETLQLDLSGLKHGSELLGRRERGVFR